MNFSENSSEETRCAAAEGNASYHQIQQQSSSITDHESRGTEARQNPIATPTSAEPHLGHEHPAQGNPPGAFDLSSYDNLQDHAYQLSASAGYGPGQDQRQAATGPVTESSEIKSGQGHQSQQLYYYPSLQPGMQYAPAQCVGNGSSCWPTCLCCATSHGTPRPKPRTGTTILPDAISSTTLQQSYVQPQRTSATRATASLPHIHSRLLSERLEPSESIGSKRSFYVHEELDSKRQSSAHQGGLSGPIIFSSKCTLRVVNRFRV